MFVHAVPDLRVAADVCGTVYHFCYAFIQSDNANRRLAAKTLGFEILSTPRLSRAPALRIR